MLSPYPLATVQLSFELLVLLLCLASAALPRQRYTFHDSRQEEYVRNLGSYDFAIPSRVTYSGVHISHSLHPNIRRKKRSAEEFSKDSEDTSDHTVHYKVDIENKLIYLKVKPNYKLYLPSLVIERRTSVFKNVTDSVFSGVAPDEEHCHFIGEILGETSSTVALEVCNGLTGLLRTSTGAYFIEPLRGHTVSETTGHPHVVYKHTSLPPHQGLHNLHDIPHQDSACDAAGHDEPSAEDKEHYDRAAARHRKDHHRRKRSISIERHIEAMVVVDPAMVEYYKNEDVKTYVLTIMNMVATLFHEASIGNAINLVIVRLVLLEEQQEELKLTHHADKSLRSFCKWQKHMNFKDDDHPNHHDIAILLTRINICSRMNEPCSTLGLAQVPGICLPHKSCNINEDTGLPLAYTVAHELGHNFGMTHDSVRNGCEMKEGEEFLYVMSAQLMAVNVPMKWSKCSREAVTKFIDRGWAFCLDDEPADFQHKEFQYPVIPPGTMYDADHQCRLVYGPEATLCEGVEEEICSTLWCRYKNKCTTKLESAAEGTICGQDKWCFNGDCVEIGERPLSINGNWGEWSSWAECSRTCGAGVSTVQRHCENPPPSNGGKYCIGERKRYRTCNTNACPEGSPSFLNVQCQDFNYIPYRNKLYKWEPVEMDSNVAPCQLHCKPKNRFFSVLLSDMVTDGTPCTLGKRNMCISGRCRHVGCDWQIDSSAREDRCGVCHGDGSTCETIKDQYNETQGLGYVEATVIPREARNIRVEEVAGANNYLAMRDNQGKYLLNGHWFIQWSGDYEMAGTIVHYERNGNKEKMEASGPLKEPIHIMLLLQSRNPGVIFEYTVPKENITETREPEFNWKYMDWTHCTASCGGGSQRSEIVCEELEAGLVEDIYCNSSNKPDDRQRACNLHLCPAKWWAGAWQHCSVSCGKNGVHRRTVICVRSLGLDEQIALEDKNCMGQDKPTEVEPCHHKDPCPGTSHWVIGQWSQCHGNPCEMQHRSVLCEDPEVGCDQSIKPDAEQQCTNITCGIWDSEDWSECTRTCGGGLKDRRVRCVGSSVCNEEEKPSEQMLCNNVDCPVTTTVASTTRRMTRQPTTTTNTQPIMTTPRAQTVTTTQTPQPRMTTPKAQPITTTPKAQLSTTTTPKAQPSMTPKAQPRITAPKATTTTVHRTTIPEPTVAKTTSTATTTLTTSEKALIRDLPLPVEEEESGGTVTSNDNTSLGRKDSVNAPEEDSVSQGHAPDQPANTIDVNLQISRNSRLDGNDGNAAKIGNENTNKEESLPLYSVMEGGVEENHDGHRDSTVENAQLNSTKGSSEKQPERQQLSADDNPVSVSADRSADPNSDGDAGSPIHEMPQPRENRPETERGRPDSSANSQTEIITPQQEKPVAISSKKTVEKLTDRKSELGVLPRRSESVPDISKPPLRGHRKGPSSGEKMAMPRLGTVNQGKGRGVGDTLGIRPLPDKPMIKPGRMDSATGFKWKSANWTECSRACGGGIQTRTIFCVDKLSGETVSNSHCMIIHKPNAIDRCDTQSCSEWETSDWSTCSATCGLSQKMRVVICPVGGICDPDQKPSEVISCDLPACLAWVHGQWSRCSQSCGGGEQVRLVQCINITSQQRGVGCHTHTKPGEKRKCNTETCPDTNHALNRHRCTRDKMSHQICRALRRMNQCAKLYVRVKCCLTCNVRVWRRRPTRRRSR